MSADRWAAAPDLHSSLLLRSARSSPFGSGRRRDVGRNRSCSVLLPQHFSHVSPGREQLSETSASSCEHRSYGGRVLNGMKSIPVNFSTTAERYRTRHPESGRAFIPARQGG
ncbi:protein of unknown function [Streptomyces sp. KY75]|nr:protein of unknown function [Streptomyces sp. KY70]CAD5983842.1 protein of unknown function [Streptomyces sp. KY75]